MRVDGVVAEIISCTGGLPPIARVHCNSNGGPRFVIVRVRFAERWHLQFLCRLPASVDCRLFLILRLFSCYLLSARNNTACA
jgi:hypothetical protein